MSKKKPSLEEAVNYVLDCDEDSLTGELKSDEGDEPYFRLTNMSVGFRSCKGILSNLVVMHVFL